MSLYVSFQYHADDRNRLIQTIGRMEDSNTLRGRPLEWVADEAIAKELGEPKQWVSVHWDDVNEEAWTSFALMCAEEDIPLVGWYDEKESGDHYAFCVSQASGYAAEECDDQQELIVTISATADYNLPLWRYLDDSTTTFMKHMNAVTDRVYGRDSKKEELPETNG